MYFANFPKIVYDFDTTSGTNYQIVTDITRNVRFRKMILENISLYDYYDMKEGETPEIVSEKIYGTPYYHWVIMLANQRYDYINDFPVSQLELDALVEQRYSVNKIEHIHHYKYNGFIREGVNILVVRDSVLLDGGIGEMAVGKILVSQTNGYVGRIDEILVQSNNATVTLSVSLRNGKFMPNETLTVQNENVFVEVQTSTIPDNYTVTSNYQYEFDLNEAKRRIKIIDPALVEQLIKEFKDTI
jgi:hypothetical protein